MLTVTLLLMLQGLPEVAAGFLHDGSASRRIRLVTDEAAVQPALLMSRAELVSERARLRELQPDVALPAVATIVGVAGTGLFLALFLVVGSSYFGIAVYLAVILISAAVVCLGVAAAGAIRLLHSGPQRRAIEAQIEEVDAAYRDGRCRNEPDQPPCLGAGQSLLPGGGLLLARF